MPLFHYFNNAFTYVGREVEILPNAIVTLYNNQTSAPLSDTIYADAAGGTTKANPFAAAANGDIEFWLAAAKYVRVVLTGTGVGTITMDFQPVLPDPSDIALISGGAYIDTGGGGSGVQYGAIYANDPVYSPGGVAINDGIHDAMPALNNAFAAAISMSTPTSCFGTLVILGPGIYRIRNLQIPSGVLLMGAGDSTILYRKNDNEDATQAASQLQLTISMSGKTNCGIARLMINGNEANNRHTVYGYYLDELFTDASNFFVEDVTVYNYNGNGIMVSGAHGRFKNVKVLGINAAQYFPDYPYATSIGPSSGPNPNYTNRLGSYQGFRNAGNSQAYDMVLQNCYVENTRLAGWAVGGQSIVTDNLVVANCHRGDSNVITGVVTPGSTTGYTTIAGGPQGGSQIGFYHITPYGGGTVGSQYPTNYKMRGLRVLPTVGAVAGGIEVNGAINLSIVDFHIDPQPKFGIHMATSAGEGGELDTMETIVADGTIFGCGGGGIYLGYKVINTTLSNIKFRGIPGGAYALDLGSNADFITATGLSFRDNAANLRNTSTGTTINLVGVTAIGGQVGGLIRNEFSEPLGKNQPTVYAITVQNNHASGQGLNVIGGTNASHISLRVGDASGNLAFYVVAGTTPYAFFNTAASAVNNKAIIGLMEAGVVKGFIGLTSTNRVGVMNAAGSIYTWYTDQITGTSGISMNVGSGARHALRVEVSNILRYAMGLDNTDKPTFYGPDGTSELLKLNYANTPPRLEGPLVYLVGWTPSIQQGGVLTLSSSSGTYHVIGNLAYISGSVIVNSAGVAGSGIVVTGWPVGLNPAAPGPYKAAGIFTVYDIGTAFYTGSVITYASNFCFLMVSGAGNYLGNAGTPTLTLAPGDYIEFTAWWQIAA